MKITGYLPSALYQLAPITRKQYDEAVEKINGEKADEISFDYEDVSNHKFYLLPACDHYIENEDGTFSYIEEVFEWQRYWKMPLNLK